MRLKNCLGPVVKFRVQLVWIGFSVLINISAISADSTPTSEFPSPFSLECQGIHGKSLFLDPAHPLLFFFFLFVGLTVCSLFSACLSFFLDK